MTYGLVRSIDNYHQSIVQSRQMISAANEGLREAQKELFYTTYPTISSAQIRLFNRYVAGQDSDKKIPADKDIYVAKDKFKLFLIDNNIVEKGDKKAKCKLIAGKILTILLCIVVIAAVAGGIFLLAIGNVGGLALIGGAGLMNIFAELGTMAKTGNKFSPLAPLRGAFWLCHQFFKKEEEKEAGPTENMERIVKIKKRLFENVELLKKMCTDENIQQLISNGRSEEIQKLHLELNKGKNYLEDCENNPPLGKIRP